VTKLGQALERRVERVIEEEKEKRPDLHVFALGFATSLLILFAKLQVGVNDFGCIFFSG